MRLARPYRGTPLGPRSEPRRVPTLDFPRGKPPREYCLLRFPSSHDSLEKSSSSKNQSHLVCVSSLTRLFLPHCSASCFALCVLLVPSVSCQFPVCVALINFLLHDIGEVLHSSCLSLVLSHAAYPAYLCCYRVFAARCGVASIVFTASSQHCSQPRPSRFVPCASYHVLSSCNLHRAPSVLWCHSTVSLESPIRHLFLQDSRCMCHLCALNFAISITCTVASFWCRHQSCGQVIVVSLTGPASWSWAQRHSTPPNHHWVAVLVPRFRRVSA